MKSITTLYESEVEIPAYTQALLNRQAQLDVRLDGLDSILQKAERGAMGITLDSAKTTEWKAAKSERERVWKDYQNVNKEINKLRKHIGYEAKPVDGKRVSIYKYKK